MEQFKRRSFTEDSASRLDKAFAGLSVRRSSRSPSAGQIEYVNNEDDDPKGPLGLNLLHTVDEPVADFIFIHGLGGGSRKTWAKTADLYHYWPKEWLSRDPEFTDVRVHSFGYKADWNERNDNAWDVHDFALSLLNELQINPSIRRSQTKIVLITHSLGGIVAKKTYTLARLDPSLKELAARFHSIYFLGTPHRGSDLAKTLSNILKISYGSKSFVTALERNSESIESVNDSFRHFAEDIHLWSFYETIPLSLVITKELIVDRASATLGYSRERTAPLNADHRSICKFETPSDPNYQTLRNAFITTLDSIFDEAFQSNAEYTGDQYSLLGQLTGISDPPIDDFTALEEVRVPNSGDWILSRDDFIAWRTTGSSSPSIFFLSGNAGTGKSYISSSVISHLNGQNLNPSYFFFKHGIAAKSTAAGCLLSLAYQMALCDESLMQRLIESQPDTQSWEQWDEKTVWRRLFLGSIFKVPNPMPLFWVIDGLDECQRPDVFLTLLAKAPPHLRIFVASRPTFEIDRSLASISKAVNRYEIQERDTLEDLEEFIESKMHLLPAGDFESQEYLKNKILDKACGSFLWVSLTVQELEHAYSEESAQNVLDELLPGMNVLYLRMLNHVSNNARSTKLARTIFTWSLLALRNLTVSELQHVLKLDLKETIPNLAKHIPVVCGQLIRVDASDQIRCVHQTARAFLLNQKEYPELSINKHSDHANAARVCLMSLKEHFGGPTRPTRGRGSLQLSVSSVDFISYASVYFSDHLQRSTSEDETTWELLCEFLENGILSWIEYLSRVGKIHHITRTAINLKSYLQRRAKYMAPFSNEKDVVESWAHDMIRVSARFRNSLLISPSCIHTMIPALCPSESILATTYASRRRGLILKGFKDDTWDECLARIDFLGLRANVVAYGDRYFAIALSNKSIHLYFHETMLAKSHIDHGENVRVLTFSPNDRYLAAGGIRYVRVWDLETMTQIHTFAIKELVLTLIFTDENTTLAAAMQGNCIVTWDLIDGLRTDRWLWNESIHESGGQKRPYGVPQRATFSPDFTTVAVAYRGLPVYLFDVQNKTFIGGCQRFAGKNSLEGGNQYFVDAMTFNPSPEIDVLVVSYGDGELIVFDLWTTELRYCCQAVFAHSLACSPDGRTLVTGCAQGIIQIFEFAGAEGSDLNLIYRIDAREEASRGIAFSGDSLRFADIHALQCRIWEPTCLVRNDEDEGSQSEFSQAVTVTPRTVTMLEGLEVPEITVMCCHPAGKLVFGGKSDGEVTYFDVQSATEQDTLYRHGVNAAIRCIAYNEYRSCLYTSDSGGIVFVYQLLISGDKCKITQPVTKIHVEFAIQSLIPSPSGDDLVIQGRDSMSQFTITDDQNKETHVALDDYKGSDFRIMNHPLNPDYLVVMNRHQIEVIPRPVNHSSMGPRGNDKEAEPETPQITISSEENVTAPTQQPPPQWNAAPAWKLAPLVVDFHPPSRLPGGEAFSATLSVWSAHSLSDIGRNSNPINLHGFEKFVRNIRQVIAILGTEIFFLDQDFWICSIDVSKCTRSTHGAVRHFFVLPEWKRDYRDMIIEYLPQRREFVIARKRGIVVIQRGLDFQEPCYTTTDHYGASSFSPQVV